MLKATLLFSLLLSLLCASELSGPEAGYRIFYDDFSGNLDDRWLLFSDPGPRLTSLLGNPVPAVDNNGAGGRKNGTMSKRRFNLSLGAVIRCDILLRVRSDDIWCGGSFGFPLDPSAFRRGDWPEWLIGMSYDYIGDLGWTRKMKREGGTLTCYLVTEDGKLEVSRNPYRNRYLNNWHTYEIVIRHDGFVEFSLDGNLIYYSRKRLSREYIHLPLLLGHRSGKMGKVYHDNVEVLTYKKDEVLER